MTKKKLGIVGASSLEVETLVEILSDNKINSLADIVILGTKAHVGKRFACGQETLVAKEISKERLFDSDALLFFSEISSSDFNIQDLLNAGITCMYYNKPGIDINSLVFRNEVTPWTLNEGFKSAPQIVLPHAVTATAAWILSSAQKIAPIESVFLSAMEGVSFEGKLGFEILEEESLGFFQVQDLTCKPSALFPTTLAYNVIPMFNKPQENERISNELSYILKIPQESILLHRVKMPVFVGLCGNIFLRYTHEVALEDLKKVFQNNSDFVINSVAEDGILELSPRASQGADAINIEIVSSKLEKGKEFSVWFTTDPLRVSVGKHCSEVLQSCLQGNVFNRSR